MYLSRLCNDFTSLSKRNIISYALISANMEVEDNTPGQSRMRTIRDYDMDTGAFIYSNILDYNNDDEIGNKYIFTNRYDWYFDNREKYEVRYIPLFVTNIKNKTNTLEELVSSSNITKIYECSISTNPPKWDSIFASKDISKINKICGQLYIVPSNGYKAMSANYKSEDIPEGIIEYNHDDYVACKKNIITAIPEYSNFTLLSFCPIYLDYDSIVWYWFKDDIFNSLFEVYNKIYDIEAKTLSNNIMEDDIAVNTEFLKKTSQYKSIAVDILNNYERDYFIDAESADDIADIVKDMWSDMYGE